MTGRVELHCHLDGSVRPATVAELAREQGVEFDRPVGQLVTAPRDCGDLMAYISYIDPVLEVLQTPDALRRAARELVEDWHADGVALGEVRFAPQLHTRRGMDMDGAVAAVARGLEEGAAATGVATGLLLCCLRHQSPEVSEEVADAAVRHRGTVSGLDLAGDESRPGTPHRAAFEAAHAASLPVTVHAGETAGPESVWEALEVLGARRIGHGVRSIEERALLDRLRADAVTLEMCPVSNVQTGAVPHRSAHPADRLLSEGFAVTVSTDARTTSATTLEREFRELRDEFGWGTREEKACHENARTGTFTT